MAILNFSQTSQFELYDKNNCHLSAADAAQSTLVNISRHSGQTENIQMVGMPSVQVQVTKSHSFLFLMFGMVTGLETFPVDFNLMTILLECLSVGF